MSLSSATPYRRIDWPDQVWPVKSNGPIPMTVGVPSRETLVLAQRRARLLALDMGFSLAGWEARRGSFYSTYAADTLLLSDPAGTPPPRAHEHDGSGKAIAAAKAYIARIKPERSRQVEVANEARAFALAQGLSDQEWDRRRLDYPSGYEADILFLTDPSYFPPPAIAKAA